MQVWLDRLMPELAKLGWDVWLGLPEGRFHDARAYLELHPWGQVVRLRNRTGTHLGRLGAVERALRRLRPDCVVAAHIPAVYQAIERLRWRGGWSPVSVASLHSLDSTMLEDVRRFAHAVDGLVGPNRLMPELAATFEVIERERALYAPAMADFSAEPDPDQVGERLEIVYAGRLEEAQKRVSDLPPIAAALERAGADWSLEIAGVGPDEALLRRGLAPFEASGRVRFRGALPPGVVERELLAPGRVLLITSVWETGPIVAWEALARGAAVVASRFVGAGLEEGLVDGVTGASFEVGDVDGASRAILGLAGRQRRREVATSGWRHGRERYSLEVGARLWHDALLALGDLAARCPPRRPQPPPPAGRLERWFGAGAAEAIRALSGRAPKYADAGGEWPSRVGSGRPEAEFLALARAVDRDGASALREPR